MKNFKPEAASWISEKKTRIRPIRADSGRLFLIKKWMALHLNNEIKHQSFGLLKGKVQDKRQNTALQDKTQDILSWDASVLLAPVFFRL